MSNAKFKAFDKEPEAHFNICVKYIWNKLGKFHFELMFTEFKFPIHEIYLPFAW